MKRHVTNVLYFPNRMRELGSRLLNYKLAIVEAPMGYGKTTFVRESLENTIADLLWQKVQDDNISEFWKSTCRQFAKVNSDLAESLAALGFPNDSTSRYEALNLIEAFDFQKDTVWIVDDYQFVACPEANEWIKFLILNGIPFLHIILIGRHTGLTEVNELVLKGHLLHIQKEDLEFSNKDIKAYYQLVGIPLKENEVINLADFTEGWISALYLVMLNYLEYGKFDMSTDILKLIENAIYRDLSDEAKELLLSLCSFDGFSLEQAIFVSQNKNAKQLLAEIISKNALVKYERESKNYQIHHLFMNFLKEELESTQFQIGTYQMVAQWFFKMKDFNQAQHYFYLCQDFESIYQCYEKERYDNLNYVFNKDTLLKFFEEGPIDIKKRHHFAILIIAMELYTHNEIESFYKVLNEFTENMKIDETLDEEDRNQLLGEYELLMSFTVYNDLRKMAIHHVRACDLMKHSSLLFPLRGIWTFGAPSILYMFYRESGKLEDALEAMFETIPNYSRATGGNAYGGEYCMKAEWYFYQGDYENALITNYQALNKAASKKQVSNIILTQFLMMRVALMKGDFLYLLELVDEMHKTIEESKEYFLLHTAQICESYIYALLDQSDKIPTWLSLGDYSSDRLLFPNYSMMDIVYGRTLLIRQEYHLLIGSLEKFLGIASVFPNLLTQIHSYIYVAAAYWRIHRQSDAVASLKEALNLGIPDKIYIPFVENGDYIMPLLMILRDQEIYTDEIKRLLKLYESYQKNKDTIRNTYFTNAAPKLSEREREIARLASEGLTNYAIGERLFISTNTVKMALKSIYNKLGINSRLLLKQYLDN
jgi:ATP-dependent transcriptional regulator